MRIITEALSDEDQRRLLDLEADMLDLKRRLIDASDSEKIDLKADMEKLKLEMSEIKERGKDENA